VTSAGNSRFDHSLFDELTGAPAGQGNLTAPAAEFFADQSAGNLEPRASSGALGAADPAQQIGDDFFGTPRPQPSGSIADMGAIEAQ
jgi:hypothetical protein